MAYSYLYPGINTLQPGYDCTITLPMQRLVEKLRDGNGVVEYSCRVYFDGELETENTEQIHFHDGVAVDPPSTFIWRDPGDRWGGEPGFVETSFTAVDGSLIFAVKDSVTFYAIYSKPGKKSYFTDTAYRYASPPTIEQIAAFGRFVEMYPVVHLDRDRNLGETLTLLNPYKRPVLASIQAHDGRKLDRLRIPPNSARNIRLERLLRDDERAWMGQVQVTATNRLITYNVKHAMNDPTMITDHEHLDPFRSDPTHMPATQLARYKFGRFLQRKGWV